MPRSVWTGIIMLDNPIVMLLQIQYNNRLDNSVTSAECQRRDGTLSVERCSLFLTVLSQTLVPIAVPSKRPNFRLERNLLRRDEVVRKRSSRGVVLRGLPDMGRSATSQYTEIYSIVNLLSIRGVGNTKQCLLLSHVGSLTLLKRHSRPTWNDV